MKSYIETLFDDFNRKYFHNDISGVVILYNRGHLKMWGQFDDVRKCIFLSPILIDYQLALEGILLHEMIHAVLWVKNKHRPEADYLWLDHTREFKKLEMKINKKHFKDPFGNKNHYQAMLMDLDKAFRS